MFVVNLEKWRRFHSDRGERIKTVSSQFTAVIQWPRHRQAGRSPPITIGVARIKDVRVQIQGNKREYFIPSKCGYRMGNSVLRAKHTVEKTISQNTCMDRIDSENANLS